jgi:hypothetical protein
VQVARVRVQHCCLTLERAHDVRVLVADMRDVVHGIEKDATVAVVQMLAPAAYDEERPLVCHAQRCAHHGLPAREQIVQPLFLRRRHQWQAQQEVRIGRERAVHDAVGGTHERIRNRHVHGELHVDVRCAAVCAFLRHGTDGLAALDIVAAVQGRHGQAAAEQPEADGGRDVVPQHDAVAVGQLLDGGGQG